MTYSTVNAFWSAFEYWQHNKTTCNGSIIKGIDIAILGRVGGVGGKQPHTPNKHDPAFSTLGKILDAVS